MLSTRAIHFAADTPYFSAKTPARGTKNRGENAYQGAMTVQNAKGKANVMRTPFQLKTAGEAPISQVTVIFYSKHMNLQNLSDC